MSCYTDVKFMAESFSRSSVTKVTQCSILHKAEITGARDALSIWFRQTQVAALDPSTGICNHTQVVRYHLNV